MFTGAPISEKGFTFDSNVYASTLPDSDSDGIADDNDICPKDSSNQCDAARFCSQLKKAVDKTSGAATIWTWVTLILGIIALALSLLGGPLGGAVGIYVGIHAVAQSIVAIGISINQSRLRDSYEESGCTKLLGWQ
ncbi:MAG: hypothetical protein F4039_07760 [Gammaproteobacteria bacterium]|nr:hypothetical protein [Gammaproteobacteria bacterium]MYF54000.1 hypothetical protein [Gammaproteobacteria bacterium]MYK43965.1 hypothetical protein [Gammaproteobacteria bacterium]